MENNDVIQEAFANLSPVVQKVLTSADLELKLQKLSKTHALHLDKWTLLENEITMTLLGITDPDALVGNIEAHVGVPHEIAQAIANDAATEIFNPIRDELEESLQHDRARGVHIPTEQKMALESSGIDIPKAVIEEAPKTVASIVAARIAEAESVPTSTTLPNKDTLPKNPVADSSHMRKSIANDLYREQV